MPGGQRCRGPGKRRRRSMQPARACIDHATTVLPPLHVPINKRVNVDACGSLRSAHWKVARLHDCVVLARYDVGCSCRTEHASSWQIGASQTTSPHPSTATTSHLDASHHPPARSPIVPVILARILPTRNTFTMVHKVLFWSGLGNAPNNSAHRYHLLMTTA
jgi:hypothetical protein